MAGGDTGNYEIKYRGLNWSFIWQYLGSFVWLEEDHFVAEDMLHVLDLMEQEKKRNFQKVGVSYVYK